MILIADSGSTKTDWTLIHSPHPMKWDIVTTFQTQGITPIHQTPDEIRQILGREMMPQLSTFPRAALSTQKYLRVHSCHKSMCPSMVVAVHQPMCL